MYEKNIMKVDIKIPDLTEKDDIIINKEFYNNIPLKYKNIINQLLKEIQNLKTNSLNYDFINNKHL